MTYMKKCSLLLVCALLLGGCTEDIPPEETGSETQRIAEETAGSMLAAEETDAGEKETASSAEPTVDELAIVWKAKDLYTSYLDGTPIDLSSPSSGEGYTAKDGIITVTEEGTYILSGTLAEGQVIVDAPKDADVRLVLENASIHSTDTSPIEVKTADKVIISLPAGTENTLTNDSGADFETEDIAGILSKEDLTLNGTGKLTVAAGSGDGIRSKDTLKITGGELIITAADRGLVGKDSVEIMDVNADITSGGDGIKSNNDEDPSRGYIYVEGGSIRIDSENDGIWSFGTTVLRGGEVEISAEDDGIHSDGDVILSGGNVNIIRSYEGIEGKTITMTDGAVTVKSSDDGLNATDGTGDTVGRFGRGEEGEGTAVYVTVSGGDLYVDAMGDGLDSNGIFTIDGGTVVVMGPENAANGYIDTAGSFTVNGGTYLGVGTSQMLVTPSASSAQLSVVWSGNVGYDGGSTVEIRDGDGNTLFSAESARRFNSVSFSSPELTADTAYDVVINGDTAGTVTAGSGSGFGGFGGGKGSFGGRGERPMGGTPPAMPEGGMMPGMPTGGMRPDMPEGGRNGGTPPDIPTDGGTAE